MRRKICSSTSARVRWMPLNMKVSPSQFRSPIYGAPKRKLQRTADCEIGGGNLAAAVAR